MILNGSNAPRTKQMNEAVDIIIPCYNERYELPKTLNSIVSQDTTANIRIIIVDNGSTDGTKDWLEYYINTIQGKIEIVVLTEPVKSHIAARNTGFMFAMKQQQDRFPIAIGADADTIFHHNFINKVIEHFNDPEVDALSCSGFFCDAFWKRVPNLTQSYFDASGTIFLSPNIIEEFRFKGKEALFTEQIFHDFVRMPSDCCFPIRKSIYQNSKGYYREFRRDGTEIFAEGWSLRFRLDRMRANIIYINEAPYQTSPRRLIYEFQKFVSGNSYSDSMSDIRKNITDTDYELLNYCYLLEEKNLQKYIIRNYILIPCITRSNLLMKKRTYFQPAEQLIRDEI